MSEHPSPDGVTTGRAARPPRPADRACELCGREKPLTFHHLIPRKVHRKGRFLRRYTKAEMRAMGIHVCNDCHRGIHVLIPNERELAESYPTRESLLAHDGFARHLAWVKRQK